MQKRGISTIVASVLMILITVASVSILWFSLYPLINQAFFVEDPNVQIKIDKASFTSYDPTNDLLELRVTRSADESKILAIRFVATDTSGNTCSVSTTEVPSPNTAKVYNLESSCVKSLKEVGVVPVYEINGKSINGQNLRTVEKLKESNLVVENSGVPPDLEFLGKDESNIDDKDYFDFSDGLIAYYPFSSIFDDSGTLNVLDYTGHGYDGTLMNNAIIQNKALVLDASFSDYVDFSNPELYNSPSSTYSAWIKPGDSLSGRALFRFQSGAGLTPILSANWDASGRPIIYLGRSNFRYFQSVKATLTDGNWHHVAFVITGYSQNDILDS